MDTEQAAAETAQYLTFTLAGEEYAVSILKVREIIRYDPTLTTVPTMPAWVRGVINLRGSVVPVIDLAVKLGVPSGAITNRTCVVVVEALVNGDHTVAGIMADSVSEVKVLAPGDVEPPPEFGTPIRGDLLKGLGKIGARFVLILDIDRVLSTPAGV
ncbi:MAG: chemotaxis protein CheW [Nitrospirota bacterium]